MIVHFDNKALLNTVERKIEPIGVEGDPPSREKGGISEADAIVREARKSVMAASGELDSGTGGNLSQEIIREEEEKEPGPELRPEGEMDLPGPSLAART